jgi:S1-C subfamily serine protease
VTCAHVADALFKDAPNSYHYILSRLFRGDVIFGVPYSIQISIPYIDIRTDKRNDEVDLAALIVPAVSTEELPYETPSVKWGDSTQLGVGDSIIVGGYPYGKQMFLFTESNRGVIQPTFYSGIISAIIPATTQTETRLLQISVPVGGGMSGGAVILPTTGEVVGMITSGIDADDIPLPMSYAIPSEVIAPFIENISFTRKKNESEKKEGTGKLTADDILGRKRS